MQYVFRAGVLAASLGCGAVVAQTTATFEDLVSPPPVSGVAGLFFANGGSNVYQGVTWDSRFRVVGADFRISGDAANPLYGLPHGGSFYVTNENDGVLNDGLMISTTRLLQGAWFGRNEYYGIGAGADQITIHAMGSTGVLASVVMDLPAPSLAGQPGPLVFVDTGGFAQLTGITGYRIDRRELSTQQGNWIADDFVFATAVPEPRTAAMLLAGLMAIAGIVGRRQRR